MSDRPTPETDETHRLNCLPSTPEDTAYHYVLNLSRRLERERDEAREEVQRVRDFMDSGFKKAKEEITAERALADRLADLLTACERWVNQPCDVKTEADKALIQWKEARSEHLP